jgi:hypothetical protein
VGLQIRIAIMEAAGRFLKKLKIEVPFDSAILFVGICPEEVKSLSQKDTRVHFHCCIIHNG